MKTLTALLSCYPNHRDLADDLGLEHDRVYRWFAFNRIPNERWRSVIEACAARGLVITVEQLLDACTPRRSDIGWPKGKLRKAR